MTTPPFRADHVGSLLRPPALLAGARDDFAAGRHRRATGCARSRTTAIRDVVRMQEDVGLQSATDGEFRRASWHMDFIYQLGGITQGARTTWRSSSTTPTGDIEFTPAGAAGRRQDRARAADLRRRLRVPRGHGRRTATPKLTIPSPSMVHYRGGRGGDRSGRSTRTSSEFWARPDRRLRRRRSGGSASSAARTCSSTTPASPTSTTRTSAPMIAGRGEDAEHLHVRYIRHINAALAGPPDGHGGHDAHVPRQLPLVVGRRGRLRLRGRGAVQRAGRGRLLPRVRRRAVGRVRAAAVRADGQAGRARAGHHQDAASWRTRTTSSAGSTRRRKYVPLDQLCLSPQCGFSSTVEGNALTYDEQVGQAAADRRDRRGGLGLDERDHGRDRGAGPAARRMRERWRGVRRSHRRGRNDQAGRAGRRPGSHRRSSASGSRRASSRSRSWRSTCSRRRAARRRSGARQRRHPGRRLQRRLVAARQLQGPADPRDRRRHDRAAGG